MRRGVFQVSEMQQSGMPEPAKRLIDAWTLEQAEAARAEGVHGADEAVRGAGAANAGRVDEAAALLRTAAEGSEDIRILFLGFQFFFRTGDHAAAESLTERRLAIAERGGETEHVARACTNLGLIHLTTGRLDSAQQHCARALAIDERLGNTIGVARDLGNLANVFEARQEFGEAERLNLRSLALARQIGDDAIAAGKLANLGDIAAATDRVEMARERWREAAELFVRAGEPGTAERYRRLSEG